MKNIKTNRDLNHAEIVKGLLAEGYTVVDLASVGGGVPDILVGVQTKSGLRLNLFMEIKSSANANIRKNQEEFRNAWCGQTTIVYSLKDALKICEYYRVRYAD